MPNFLGFISTFQFSAANAGSQTFNSGGLGGGLSGGCELNAKLSGIFFQRFNF
jgi:hypothetical protein